MKAAWLASHRKTARLRRSSSSTATPTSPPRASRSSKFAAEAAQAAAHESLCRRRTAREVGFTPLSQTTGENVRLGKTAVVQAPRTARSASTSTPITGKIGVIMSFTGNPSEDLIRQVGGHIAFARPLGLTAAQKSPPISSPRKRDSPSSKPKPPASRRTSPRKSPKENSTASSPSASCSTRNSSTPGLQRQRAELSEAKRRRANPIRPASKSGRNCPSFSKT